MSRPLSVAYLFTTFPKSTETFLQREIVAMLRLGCELRLYSMWGGGGEFHGVRVHRFNPWTLVALVGVVPWIAITRRDVFGILWRGLWRRRAPSWLNFWENMLGAGFAALHHRAFRRSPPDLIHAPWSGAPATAAWCLSRMNGHRFSAGAHAYDIYENGGDWWLCEKLADAAFVHTSTGMAARSLQERGVTDGKIHVIRRGLDFLPELKPLRAPRLPLRMVCIARLVEKKGLGHQLRIYAALQQAGVSFEARIIGEGPLREQLEREAARLALGASVRFLGQRPSSDVWRELSWADVLVHTGVVAASGDRDGLPNVIPEAMAAGAVVITSPAAATTEAIEHEVTGLVADPTDAAAWVAALRRVVADDALAARLRHAARAWVEQEFDAYKNAARLHALFQKAVRP